MISIFEANTDDRGPFAILFLPYVAQLGNRSRAVTVEIQDTNLYPIAQTLRAFHWCIVELTARIPEPVAEHKWRQMILILFVPKELLR